MNTFQEIVQSIKPIRHFRGFPLYNICDVLDTLEKYNVCNPYGYTSEDNWRYADMQLEATLEEMDAYLYSFPKHECLYSEAIELALRAGKSAIVLQDLS